MALSERESKREIRAVLDRFLEVARSVPPQTASEAEWDAWMDLDELQAVVAGWAGRGANGRRRPDDPEFLRTANAHMNSPAVRALLGDQIEDVERLIRLLYDNLR